MDKLLSEGLSLNPEFSFRYLNIIYQQGPSEVAIKVYALEIEITVRAIILSKENLSGRSGFLYFFNHLLLPEAGDGLITNQ